MAIYYVNNGGAGFNGYGAGSDSNNGTSTATPFLTIGKADSVRGAGDTVIINPTSSSRTSANNPYIENNGSNFLTISSTNGTIQADPNFPSLYVVVQTVATSRVINLNGGNTNLILIDIIADAQAVSAKAGFTHHNQPGLTYTRSYPVNLASNAFGFNSPSGAGNIVTWDRCTLDPTCHGTFSLCAIAGNFTVKGGSYPINTTTQIVFQLGSGGGTAATSFTLQADDNGGRIAFSGNGIPVLQNSDTLGTLTASGFDMNNCQRGIYLNGVNTTIAITSAITIHDFTVTYGSNSTVTWIAGLNENCVAPTIYNGTITQTGQSVDCLSISNFTGSPVVHDLTIVNNGNNTGHSLIIGTDGYNTDQSNAAATTGNQNLGDVGGNGYVDQFLTTTAISNLHSSYLGTVSVQLLKVGSPTGNIVCACYADSAGVPGTLIETSDVTLAATSLTGSAQAFQFSFASNTYVAPGTKIHFRFHYTGAINGTDYVQMQRNGTTTIGSILTSSDGSSWSADASHALLITLFTGNYGITDPIAYNNKISTTDILTEQHMILFGCTTRGKQYRNQLYGGGIGIGFKLTKGTVGNPALGYDNLQYCSVLPIGTGWLAKAARYVSFYQNTLVMTSGIPSASAFRAGPDTNGLIVNQQQSDNIIFENNIIVNNDSVASCYNVQNNSLGAPATNITIDYNDVYCPAGNYGQIGGSSYTSWASWQGTGYDIHSINTDPLLANETNPSQPSHFIPKGTSPAINIGANLTAIVPTDYFGNTFSYLPTVGAIQVQNRTITNSRSAANNRTLLR